MAVLIKSLADDHLSANTTETDVLTYTAPTSPARTAVVRSVRLVNADDTVAAAVLIECQTATQSRDNSGGSPPFRGIVPPNTVIPPNGSFTLEEEITLGSGDQLKVTLQSPASDTAELDVVISGIEREVP